MDTSRFDALTRSLLHGGSRRGVLAGLASGLLASLPLAHDGEAADSRRSRRRRKPKLNAYGCLNVGQPCSGKDDRCCSGICKGNKPPKGKADQSRCVAHNTGGCTPQRSLCVTGSNDSYCAPDNFDAVCVATTGNAGFCASNVDLTPAINCRDCRTDQECEAAGFPAGSACVILTGVGCVGAGDCNGINDSQGTACVPPGA